MFDKQIETEGEVFQIYCYSPILSGLTTFLSPRVQLAWLTHMHRFLSVCRAVTGTHFATRVPAYQSPAGTRVPVYWMEHVLRFKSRPRLSKSVH